MQRLSTYIHELENWSNFTWRLEQLILPLSEVHILQGRILGKINHSQSSLIQFSSYLYHGFKQTHNEKRCNCRLSA
jgi:hypothetical protein